MARPTVDTPSPRQNRVLAALPAEEFDRLAPHLQLVELPLGTVLHTVGDVPRHAYFPTDSIVSLLNVLEDGSSTEISVVGHDGVIGITLVLGGEMSPRQAVVQVAGHAYRLARRIIQDEFHRSVALRLLLLRYTQAQITQMAQTVVCNRHHTVDQQLCRWLLLTLDRLPSREVIMTQELIANMLGVRREGVTTAVGRLERLGVITHTRGHIVVLDRPALERLSCECYAVVKQETDRLMPLATGSGKALKSPA